MPAPVPECGIALFSSTNVCNSGDGNAGVCLCVQGDVPCALAHKARSFLSLASDCICLRLLLVRSSSRLLLCFSREAKHAGHRAC